MRAGMICSRDPVTATSDTSIQDVARLMREHHVGDVVVVKDSGGIMVPIGMLTDRDIVVEAIAADVPLDRVTAGDIMSREPVTVTEDHDVSALLKTMAEQGVHRLPVLDAQGGLIGVLSTDVLLGVEAENISRLYDIVVQAQRSETSMRGSC